MRALRPREEFLAGPGGTGKNCWNSCACRTRITTSARFIFNTARPEWSIIASRSCAATVSHFCVCVRAPRRCRTGPAPIASGWPEQQRERPTCATLSAQLFLSFPFALTSRPRKCEQRRPAQCCALEIMWFNWLMWSERRWEQEWLTCKTFEDTFITLLRKNSMGNANEPEPWKGSWSGAHRRPNW